MTTIRAFFPKNRALFSNFSKRAGKTSPPSPSSYAPVCQVTFQRWGIIQPFLSKKGAPASFQQLLSAWLFWKKVSIIVFWQLLLLIDIIQITNSQCLVRRISMTLLRWNEKFRLNENTFHHFWWSLLTN